jgi:hypothetical protein
MESQRKSAYRSTTFPVALVPYYITPLRTLSMNSTLCNSSRRATLQRRRNLGDAGASLSV